MDSYTKKLANKQEDAQLELMPDEHLLVISNDEAVIAPKKREGLAHAPPIEDETSSSAKRMPSVGVSMLVPPGACTHLMEDTVRMRRICTRSRIRQLQFMFMLLVLW
jgi:hypothetical protein